MAQNSGLRRMSGVAVFALTAIVGPVAVAHGPDPHAHHSHAAGDAMRSTADYVVPDVNLVREDGTTVLLAKEIDDGRPVVLNFIYTTCTSICPLTSQTFAELQSRLGSARDSVHLMSISIDPEQDTPARLREYASRFGAGPEWQHYTGTLAASREVQRAFNVDRGAKMNHTPVTFVRTAGNDRWIRLDGFATVDELVRELRSSIALH